MPPAIALLVCSAVLLLLIRHDSKTDSTPSLALWVPVTWMFFMGSRLPSQWVGRTDASLASAFMDGSPLDRGVFLVLMALAIGILAARKLNWGGLIARNFALASFLLFALVSVVWSDFPLVTFKRWFRDMGMYLMLLVVVAHPQPTENIATFIRRLSYLLVFLSVLLVKYYTPIGVSYNVWSGTPEFVGATTSKNMLGAVCLISGLFFFWDTLRRWPDRRIPRIKFTLFVNIALIAMTLWLLMLSSSATASVCLVIGCVVVALLNGKWTLAYPRAVKAMIPVTLSIYGVLELAFELSSTIAVFLGRDPSLTGRTGIWETVLAVENNPLIGVGYQSFWLGDRLAAIWRTMGVSVLNEAHNGYLEVYLSLGAIGLAMLGLLLVSSFWRLSRQLSVSPRFASLGLSLWSITIVYNMTEAAFPASLLWSVFLLCGIVVPLSKADTRQKFQRAPTSNRSPVTSGGTMSPPRTPLAARRRHATHRKNLASRPSSIPSTSRTFSP